MREIKFKAYAKAYNKIVNVDRLGLNSDGTAQEIIVTERELGEYDSDEWTDLQAGEFELLQYAGLKDKNGKEIYEGDILELRANPFNKKRDLFQVVFKDGGFRDEWNNYIGQYLPPDIRNRQGGRVRLNEACEVVGNIYENPELIEL